MLGGGLGSQPTTQCGIFGSDYAVEFDGGDGAIVLPDEFLTYWNQGTADSSPMTNLSVSMWVNLRDNDGDTSQSLFVMKNDSSNNGFSFQFHRSSSEFRFAVRIDGTYKEATYNEASFDLADYFGQGWIHLAGTFTHNGSASGGDGDIKIYKNGALIETVTQNTNWADINVDGATIGSNESESSGFTDGYIDQLAIFNTTLSDAEVATIYNSGVMMDLTTIQPSYTLATIQHLIAYYQFENNTFDSGISKYHGTSQGGVGFTNSQP